MSDKFSQVGGAVLSFGSVTGWRSECFASLLQSQCSRRFALIGSLLCLLVQVISPHEVMGVVEVVEHLSEIQS